MHWRYQAHFDNASGPQILFQPTLVVTPQYQISRRRKNNRTESVRRERRRNILEKRIVKGWWRPGGREKGDENYKTLQITKTMVDFYMDAVEINGNDVGWIYGLRFLSFGVVMVDNNDLIGC
ncbi:hypothetical protein QE152_g33829 [Popillia japonica]|uniref:Uncharacterized protein n=1 Tax=Popillia japonica TaxID=7064 RepID=A0AAW1IVS0_POPJA